MNNVIGPAKAAKTFGVPTTLTTVLKGRSGALIPGLQDVFPDTAPVDRTFINAWEHSKLSIRCGWTNVVKPVNQLRYRLYTRSLNGLLFDSAVSLHGAVELNRRAVFGMMLPRFASVRDAPPP